MVTKIVNGKSYQSRLKRDVMMATYLHSIQRCHFDAMSLLGDMCTHIKKNPARA